MALQRFCLVVTLAVGLFFGPLYTAGDVGPLTMFKGGGVVSPKSPHESIRLDFQEIVIRLRHGSYTVNCQFHLFNEGEDTQEWIGFPKWVASRLDSYPTFIAFNGSFEGRRMEFNEQNDLSWPQRLLWIVSSRQLFGWADRALNQQRQWLTTRVRFAGHAPARIDVSYQAPYYGKHALHASYLYGTGSLWKGNIGKAVFIVDSTERGGTKEILTRFEKGPWPGEVLTDKKPESRAMGKNVLCLVLRDFEPEAEEHLSITLPGSLRKAAQPPAAHWAKPPAHPPPPPSSLPRPRLRMPWPGAFDSTVKE